MRQQRERIELLPDLLQDVLLAARPVVVGRFVACAGVGQRHLAVEELAALFDVDHDRLLRGRVVQVVMDGSGTSSQTPP